MGRRRRTRRGLTVLVVVVPPDVVGPLGVLLVDEALDRLGLQWNSGGVYV